MSVYLFPTNLPDATMEVLAGVSAGTAARLAATKGEARGLVTSHRDELDLDVYSRFLDIGFKRFAGRDIAERAGLSRTDDTTTDPALVRALMMAQYHAGLMPLEDVNRALTCEGLALHWG